MRWRMGDGRFMENHLRMLSKSSGVQPSKHPDTFHAQSGESPFDRLRANGHFFSLQMNFRTVQGRMALEDLNGMRVLPSEEITPNTPTILKL
jgi:hypothetical protein